MIYEIIDMDRDYPILRKWWARQRHAILPREILPQLGVRITSDPPELEPICIAFLYLTSATLGHASWLTTNPERPLTERHEAIQLALRGIENVAEANGVTHLVTTTARSGLKKTLERRLGYKADPKPHYLMFKKIGESA